MRYATILRNVAKTAKIALLQICNIAKVTFGHSFYNFDNTTTLRSVSKAVKTALLSIYNIARVIFIIHSIIELTLRLLGLRSVTKVVETALFSVCYISRIVSYHLFNN